ncbi:MAG: FtsX-like permease family protein [Bacteroidota bacterium]
MGCNTEYGLGGEVLMSADHKYPPKIFLRFFRWFCHPELEPYIEGDLMELYFERSSELGKKKADRLFAKDVILLFRPSIIRPASGYQQLNNYGMLKNYFKVAFRNLFKNKAYVLINTLGMGVALACCMAAYLLVAFNIEFNDGLKQSELTDKVVVLNHLETESGRPYQYLASPMPLGPIAADEVAGIEQYSRYVSESGSLSHGDKVFGHEIHFADKDFLKMFGLELLSGTTSSFDDLKTIFLNESLAIKYFGSIDVVGEVMTVEIRDQPIEVTVGGVYEDFPLNTSFTHKALMRIENYMDIFQLEPNAWESWREATLIFSLADINLRESISAQLGKYVEIRNDAKEDTKTTGFELVPFINDIDEDSVNWSYFNLVLPFVPLLIFIGLAVIILLIASFNLTNTTIALTVKRLKEIGVRKVVGARRRQIVLQFLLEVLITVVLATVVGLLMAQIIVPEFASMWGAISGMDRLNGMNLMITMVILTFASAILAGAYPALFNSRFKPVALLKGSLRIKGTNPLINGLLVVQFSLSVIMLIAGIVFTQNAIYQKEMSFGYDVDQVMILEINGPREYEKLRNAIKDNPKIEQVSVVDHHFGYGTYSNPIKLDGKDIVSNVAEVGANYFNTMGLDFTIGRDFIENSELDYETAAIVDENFVKRHGLTDPLNTSLVLQGNTYQVVGVVKNHLNNFSDSQGMEKDNFYRIIRPDQYEYMAVRSEEDAILDVQAYVQKQWKEIFPQKPFLSRLQEDVVYRNANRTNKNLKKIFLFLTFLGALLSASGIYALASINVERRTKEVGIRKVLGATVVHIVNLVNREFAIVLSVAVVLGSLGGYYLTSALLDEIYTLHIEVGLITVIVCALSIFIIGIFTTSFTIFKSASTSPVVALKSE